MKKKVISILLLLLIILSSCTLKTKSNEATGSIFLMDTFVVQKWYGDKAKETVEEIEEELLNLEKTISLYITSSDISKINDNAGKAYVKVSDVTFDLIKNSLKVCKESNGLFDITIAPLSTLWDVTNENPKVPCDDDIKKAQSLISYEKVLLNENDNSIMLKDFEMKLDLGGAAKGYAASLTREIALKNKVNGYISIGGNMMVIGKKDNGNDFSIGLRDPRKDESSYIGTVTLDGYTMATTGDYERYFIKDDIRYHHILNPFSGYPESNGLISVTVISKDGLLADCMSTLIFLSGPDNIKDYLDSKDYYVLAIDENKNVVMSEEFSKLYKHSSKEYMVKESF